MNNDNESFKNYVKQKLRNAKGLNAWKRDELYQDIMGVADRRGPCCAEEFMKFHLMEYCESTLTENTLYLVFWTMVVGGSFLFLPFSCSVSMSNDAGVGLVLSAAAFLLGFGIKFLTDKKKARRLGL